MSLTVLLGERCVCVCVCVGVCVHVCVGVCVCSYYDSIANHYHTLFICMHVTMQSLCVLST